jgi:hypothetical protein
LHTKVTGGAGWEEGQWTSGAEALVDLDALRGAEAPLFHGAAGIAVLHHCFHGGTGAALVYFEFPLAVN